METDDIEFISSSDMARSSSFEGRGNRRGNQQDSCRGGLGKRATSAPADQGGASSSAEGSRGEAPTVHCGPYEYRVGLYGWRRRCLYSLVLLLLVTVLVNLALTLFILRVLDFRMEGIGGLEIVDGGIIASGEVHVMDTLIAAKITSRPHAPIRVVAAKNVTLAALDDNGVIANSLFLGPDGLSCTTNHFLVKDMKGKILFSASKDSVIVGAKKLYVRGEGGTVFSGSVQTPHVTAPLGDPLLLESTTRNLEVSAPKGVVLEARAGKIQAECREDFTIQSTDGSIKLDSRHIYMKGLKLSEYKTLDPQEVRPDVYQVCVCLGGRLFLAAPGGVCAAGDDVCR